METVLQINNLTIGYGKRGTSSEKVIFRGINASAGKGEVISLLGANGSGKSTLMRSIAMMKQWEGEIVCGKFVTYVPAQSIRTRNFSVFDMLSTALYFQSDWLGNIGEKERQNILDVLTMVGLAGFEQRNTYELSDGEFQRVQIAVAIVKGSDIILLDEPMAFLDIPNKYLVGELMKKLAHENGKTIIYSTHDLQGALDNSDRVWIMGVDGFYDTDSKRAPIDKLFPTTL